MFIDAELVWRVIQLYDLLKLICPLADNFSLRESPLIYGFENC